MTSRPVEILHTGSLAGLGLAYVSEEPAQPHMAAGRLVRVLEDGVPAFPGYPPLLPTSLPFVIGFALLVTALRYRS